MVALDRDKARLTSDGWEVDEGAVVVHVLLNLLEPVREHPVELAGQDRRVARDDALALVRKERVSFARPFRPRSPDRTLWSET